MTGRTLTCDHGRGDRHLYRTASILSTRARPSPLSQVRHGVRPSNEKTFRSTCGSGSHTFRGCLQRLIVLDRRACVEQHPLAAELLVQPGAPRDLQRAGIQADEPHHRASFRRAPLAFRETGVATIDFIQRMDVWYPLLRIEA